MAFQATFHTTFSQRRIWILDSTTNLVFPAFRRAVKSERRVASRDGERRGLGKRPISVFSDFMCVTIPGEVWVAPTHVCDRLLIEVGRRKARGL